MTASRPESCCVCEGKDISTPLPYLNELYEGASGSIFNHLEIFFCFNCEMGFAHPFVPKKALEDFYQHTYRSAHSYQLDDISLLNRYGRRAVSQIQLAKTFWIPVRKPLNILDIGAGNGSFLLAAKALFTESRLFAAEPDVHCHTPLRKLGAILIDPFTEKASQDEDVPRFDLIACSHVLEHYNARDLDAALCRIKDVLSPQGVIVVEVPYGNIRRYPEPRDNDAPHLCFFSEHSLRSLLERHFKVVFCEGCGPDFLQTLISKAKRKATPAPKSRSGLWRSFAFGLRNLDIPVIQRAVEIRRKLQLPYYHEYLRDENYTYGADRLVIRAVLKRKAQ